jgi:cytoskeletal protein CcmA (bactofilin family)
MNIPKALVAALVIAGVGFVGANSYAAPVFLAEENKSAQSISTDQTLDSTVFIAADSVRVDGTVNGDVFCAGSSVLIAGTVNGDVICAGSSITIEGQVNGDVRLLASSVTVNGTVEGNASVAASDFVIATDAEVAGDLLGAVSSLTVNGTVGRDVTLAAERAIISGNVERDVTAAISRLTINEDATVGGNVEYTSDQRATINGTVNGETIFNDNAQLQKDTAAASWMSAAAVLVVLLMIGLLVFLGAVVAPRAVQALGDVSWASFGIAAVVGVTTVIITPIFLFVLFISAIGAYLGYILLLFWLLLMAIAPVWFGYFVGSKIVGNRTTNILLRATVGALVLMVALAIPILNIITFLVMLFVGVGLPLLGVPKLFAGKPYEAEATHSTKKTPAKKARE